MPNRKKLGPKVLQEFLDTVRADARLRAEVIGKLATTDLMSVVGDLFELDDKQLKNTGNLASSKEMEQQLKSSIIAALKTGGTIRLLPPDTTLVQPQSAGVTFGVHNGRDGTDVNVDIHCLQ
jgi:hypothetical protein